MGCREQRSHKIRAENSALGRSQTEKRGGGKLKSSCVGLKKKKSKPLEKMSVCNTSLVSMFSVNADFRNPV